MRLIFPIFMVFVFFITSLFIFLLNKNFLNCPYPDFLSWDGNLRFITTLRIMDSIRNFEVFNLMRLIFDAPTWPTLRNIVQTLVFFIFDRSGEIDVSITVFFLFLTSISFPYIFFKIEKGRFSLIYSIVGVILLFYSDQYLLYSHSSMLEVQGGFFTLFFIYSFYRFQIRKSGILPVFISLFLTYQTKYPYGYINLFFILLYSVIFFNSEMYQLGIKYTQFIKNKYIIFTFFILFLFLGVSVLLRDYLPGKISFYLKYFFIINFSWIHSYFIFKCYKEKSNTTSRILLFLLVPLLLFTILHPDRVGSSIGTISHIQSEGKSVGDTTAHDLNYYLSFFYTLFSDLWNNSYLGLLIFVLQLLSFSTILKIFQGIKNRNIPNHSIFSIKNLLSNIESNRIKFIKKNPSFLVSFYIFISLFGLTFLTPNHQSRHVFHLYPSLILGSLLYFKDFPLYFKLNNYITKFIIIFRIIIFLSIIYFLSYFMVNLFVNKFSDKYLCFGGIIDIYDTPLFFKKELPPIITENSFLINKIESEHLNKVDTELVFSQISYEKKLLFALTEREYLKNPDTFKAFIVLERNCTESLSLIESKYKSRVFQTKQVSNINGCITKFIKL